MKKLLVIVGPTGTGKTDVALKLAKDFQGELISADSRQIYSRMDIGTGKIPGHYKLQSPNIKKEKGLWVVDGIPIYLYDLISPKESFSVGEYQQLAYKTIEELHKKGKLPILVGGTGLYVQSVVEGLKIPKVQADINLRNHLEAQPLKTLVLELEKVDPKSAKNLDLQNPRRVIRALEVYYLTKTPFSAWKDKFKPDFESLQIGLNAERSYLYEKVDKRIENWFKEGFVEEVKNLLNQGYTPNLASMTSLGYRQVIMYLESKISMDEAIQRMKWDTHKYIRSQNTWFKKRSNIFWFDITQDQFVLGIEKLVKNWLQ